MDTLAMINHQKRMRRKKLPVNAGKWHTKTISDRTNIIDHTGQSKKKKFSPDYC